MTDNTAATEGLMNERGRLMQLVFGTMAAQTLRAAVELKIVEVIGEEERTAEEVARDCGTQPVTTLRLLRALAGLGLLSETGTGAFTVAPAGLLLDERRSDSLASLIWTFSDPFMTRAWEHLADSVRTGQTSFDKVFGAGFFTHLGRRPDLSARFNAAMSQGSRATADALPAHYDFGRFSTVVDVGGGDGTVLAAILKAYPALHGVLYDTAEGMAQAAGTFERAAVTDRAEQVAGDFFVSVPPGGDLYLLKSVIHDWNDEQCAGILRRCAERLPAHGRVLIIEPLLPPQAGQVKGGLAYLSDLNMLVNVGGRERTPEEFENLCHLAGLSTPVITTLPQPHAFAMIEAAAKG
ncbi:methyltransferase [Nonomuraea longispora]|nr:methyltransferase [Nonomuraea longispora]